MRGVMPPQMLFHLCLTYTVCIGLPCVFFQPHAHVVRRHAHARALCVICTGGVLRCFVQEGASQPNNDLNMNVYIMYFEVFFLR